MTAAAPDRESISSADAALAGQGPVVRIDGVSAPSQDEAFASQRLSFALAAGSFHLLTGAAGCGKTSLLRLICLADRPASGRVQLFGRDTASLSRREIPLIRRRIGLVFAEDRLLEHLTVFDNAALIPRIIGRKPGDYAPQVAQVLTWMGLGKRMDALPGALSAGERRRLALARAVADGPEILLADEPTGGLDGEPGRRILRSLVELNSAGTTVLMASRNEELAAASGAPVLHLHEGRLTLIDGFDPGPAP